MKFIKLTKSFLYGIIGLSVVMMSGCSSSDEAPAPSSGATSGYATGTNAPPPPPGDPGVVDPDKPPGTTGQLPPDTTMNNPAKP